MGTSRLRGDSQGSNEIHFHKGVLVLQFAAVESSEQRATSTLFLNLILSLGPLPQKPHPLAGVMPLADKRYAHRRPDAVGTGHTVLQDSLLLYGMDGMSTDDVKDAFSDDLRPASVDWLNGSTCMCSASYPVGYIRAAVNDLLRVIYAQITIKYIYSMISILS